MFDLNSGLLDTLTSLSLLPYINKMLNLKNIKQYMDENICILTRKEIIFFKKCIHGLCDTVLYLFKFRIFKEK